MPTFLGRRRVLLLVIGGLAAVGLWWSLAGSPGPPGVTRENAYRLRRGMSLEEAEAILGPRGLPLGTGHVWSVTWFGGDLSAEVDCGGSQREAVSAGLMIRQSDGTVVRETLFRPQEPLLDRVRRWLHLR